VAELGEQKLLPVSGAEEPWGVTEAREISGGLLCDERGVWRGYSAAFKLGLYFCSVS